MPTYSPKPWRFVQLGGEKKEFLLQNYSAPFGRPRQKPVVRDATTVRQSEVYYAGNDKPTRHIFGLRAEPWELTGRFSDKENGSGYARGMTAYVKRFVNDMQPVAIHWGDIVTATGLIETFDPGREAEYEVEWRMKILIDGDEDTPPPPAAITARRSVQDQVNQAIAALTAFSKKLPSSDSLKPGFLESIDNFVSSVNASIASITSVASQIDSFEKALVGDVRRLRAGIGQIKTAVLSLRNTLASAQNDAVLIRRSATTDTDFLGLRAQSDIDMLKSMSMLAQLDRQAEIAERGRVSSSYVAQMGDSWESISTKLLGGPDKAQKIRDLNGIRHGEPPQPGRAYKIPFQ